ncbi:polysaccharide lyase 8 family protein [Paenibacillus sp. IB182496]|uniref:Polysaccharide lyase 8 family protein n=1 Tax=Paenibacillus sabuli TaxID=2772509 RepID=A0A927BSD5_9BACL|nr:polysaccharide lyase 8 family protein [Paenibacillus sabuli]MBD2844880.1 polysaccharide lyase 8 family protein [Paenibacillus sabuli]
MFDRLFERWRSGLVGGSGIALESSDPGWRVKIDRVTQTARGYARMIDPSGEEALWPDVPKLGHAGDLRENYLRLLDMATALATPGSALYEDAAMARSIVQGLAWMYERRYNEHVRVYGNWWHWEIGAPLQLLNTLCVMRGQLDAAALAAYVRVLDRFVPNPEMMRHSVLAEPYPSTGANRVWKSRAFLLLSLLKQDADGIRAASAALAPVFELADAGDGFYADGSFIQHKKFAYTGGYGKSLLKELAELAYMLHGSPWALPSDQVSVMVGWVRHSFEPFLYRGQMMDLVRGREISRRYPDSHSAGHAMIGAALQLAEVASPGEAGWLKGKAKQWMQQNTYRSYMEEASLPMAVLARPVLQDDTVQGGEEAAICRVFPRMDRAMARGTGYAVGISMFSERTGSYESINGENRQGWYTAHGMISLYNADLAHYSDGFWPTVDPYRLPGTTVSSVPREIGFGLGRREAGAFVGGVECGGKYGLVGMELVEPGEFRARKSWLLCGDVVMALGTVLEGAQVPEVETIVENRMLSRDGSNTLLIEADGACRAFTEAGVAKTVSPRWMHLSGTVPGAEIGYVFPRPKPLRLLREARRMSSHEMEEREGAAQLTRDYMTAWFEHDARAGSDHYAYVLLPGRSPEEVAAYAADPGMAIVTCTSDRHAIEDRESGLFAVHFWEDGMKSAGPVSCNKRASIVVQERADQVEMWIADPAQADEGSMAITLHLAVEGVECCDDRIAVQRLHPSVAMSVNRGGAKGSTLRIVFRKSKHNDS